MPFRLFVLICEKYHGIIKIVYVVYVSGGVNFMEIGINTMSAMNAMRADFEGTVKRLKAGGCDWLEAMSDWGAKQETIDFYSNLTGGPSGWDPENAELRMEIARKNGMSIKGLFIFDERLDEQAQKLGEILSEKRNFLCGAKLS